MLSELWNLRGVLRNRHLSPEELRRLQEQGLRRIVRHASRHVPYYGRLFQSAGLDPGDIRTLEDLRRIPVTTKERIQSEGTLAFVSRSAALDSCRRIRTTGSSGRPVTIYHSRGEGKVRQFLGFRSFRAAGLRPLDRLCILGSNTLYPVRLHHRFGIYRTHHIPVLLSVPEQIRRLEKMRPTFLKCWPTVLRSVMHATDYRLGRVIRPRVLMTSAEVFEESLRREVRRELDADVYSVYVASEFGQIAYECSAHRGLHVNADQVILEILDENGEPCGPGQPGVVVGTNLYAYTMPFIRFNLGDISRFVPGACSCGLHLPLMDAPRGRLDDVMVLPDGSRRSATGLAMSLNRYEDVRQLRLVQEQHDRYLLQLVSTDAGPGDTGDRMRAHILEYVGAPVEVRVERVDFIPSETAKFRWFVSRMPQS
ncbi:MAG: phenylacetate--CoA ligase [Acidobacteria bacterium]|nr:phenylacetate--CoA ligase [Acidobacteriota bacterium]